MTTPREQDIRLRPLRGDGSVDLNLDQGDAEYASGGDYYVLTKVGLDFHTGESTADLVELSPVNIDFDSDTPPPDRILRTQNLDIDLGDKVPEVKAKARRERFVGPEGTTHRVPLNNRGRGRRDFRR